jgi:hypothetical protein
MIIHIAPLDPAYKAGVAVHVPVKHFFQDFFQEKVFTAISFF